MTDVQKKLLELLNDIDRICTREKIRYYLCAETAHAAFTTQVFPEDCCEASVAMLPGDALRFIAAVEKEKRSDRVLDSMYSNKEYPDFTMRYGDTGTLMLKLPFAGNGALPCIAVTIHMIRYKPKRIARLYGYMAKFWKACTSTPEGFSRPAVRTAVKACHVVRDVLGGKYFSRMLFKIWCAMFSANKKSKKISVCSGKYVYDAEILKETERFKLEGCSFISFGYIDSYLKSAYGDLFAQQSPKYLKASSALLTSVHVSYQKYLESAKKSGVDFDAIKQNKIKYDVQQRKVSAYNKRINKCYDVVARTEKRFALYEQYMPMKEQLKALHAQQRYEELNELLQSYRRELNAFYQKGLGLCFDKEIFEMTMDLLQREGSYTYVRKLRAMVPAQHWEPMVITDYKGEQV